MECAFVTHGMSAIANSDQGVTCSAHEQSTQLVSQGVAQSVDNQERWVDNADGERAFRPTKQECIYIILDTAPPSRVQVPYILPVSQKTHLTVGMVL
jgi:hypothetical protein